MRRDLLTTSVNIPRDLLALLRRAAAERAIRDGCRPSVSGVIVDLVQANRAALTIQLPRKLIDE